MQDIKQNTVKENKACKKPGKDKQTSSLHQGGAIFAAIFEPYQGKGLLEICNRKQTRKYDYMLNKVACKKENKTKSKLKKRD